jgi:hypothetical protein
MFGGLVPFGKPSKRRSPASSQGQVQKRYCCETKLDCGGLTSKANGILNLVRPQAYNLHNHTSCTTWCKQQQMENLKAAVLGRSLCTSSIWIHGKSIRWNGQRMYRIVWRVPIQEDPRQAEAHSTCIESYSISSNETVTVRFTAQISLGRDDE